MRFRGLLIVAAGLATAGTAPAATLVGFAALPADTFVPGPTSGQFGVGGNGSNGPFVGRQPVQGFSAILSNGRGGYQVMADNGFGTKANSADALLYVHDVDVDFRTAAGGSGTVTVNGSSTLSDPNRKLGFTTVADQATYYGGTIPVDPAIRDGRLLTGADLDIESFRRVADGSYYFGDEFGPYLVHTDAQFRVIDKAIPLPGVQSVDNPLLAGGKANLASSGGFEGMALSTDGKTLYTLLEKTVTGDAAGTLRINAFDVASQRFTDQQFTYALTEGGTAIGDMTAIGDGRFVVIERDGGQGAAAKFKRIYGIDLNQVDANGRLVKTELLDLMNIADPDDLNGDGSTSFSFPFVTIEDVLPVDEQTLLIVNDNNYPGSAGRTPGRSDNNEFIKVRLDRPFAAAVPEPSSWALMIAGFGVVGGALRRRGVARFLRSPAV
ncbi:esterase-like activity of phytase family protein [Sphingomonas sp. 1P08PE]